MIAWSLVFMVAGFLFLLLGRGANPNVFQFLSIAASLVAGTLLVMGYLRERKKRPEAAGDPSASTTKGEIKAGAPAELEADLRALEDGSEEEESRPEEEPVNEPLVSSRAAGAPRKRSGGTRRESRVLEPAMAGGGADGSGNSEPLRMTSSSASPSTPLSPETESRGATPSGGFEMSSENPETPPVEPAEGQPETLTSANRQWASLISNVDAEKFEPPAFEKPKGRAKSAQPEPAADQGKTTATMEQPAGGPESQKTEKRRGGLFGLFRRKETAAAASRTPEAKPQPADSGGEGMGASAQAGGQEGPAHTPAAVAGANAEMSAGAIAEEMSAAREEVAAKVAEEPSAADAETAPTGEGMEAAVNNAAAAGAGTRRKTSARKKTSAKAAKAKTAAKPKTRGRPKASTATRAPAKARTGATRTSAKPAAPRGRGATGATARTTAKRKPRAPRGSAG